MTRMIDVYKTYGPTPICIRKAFRLKYDIECHARNSWPNYPSYKEDKKLRNSKIWDAKYREIRPVMWDVTNNVPACEEYNHLQQALCAKLL